MDSKSTGAVKKGCQCCQHCHRNKSGSKRRKSEPLSQIDNNRAESFSVSPNLSELGTGDINGSLFNDTASSMRTLASTLQAVDIPVYDDSQDEYGNSPEKSKQKCNEWNTSPKFGESASMLIEQKQQEEQQPNQRDVEDSVDDQDETKVEDITNNKEFYERMMVQVQKMMFAQNMSPDEKQYAQDTGTTENQNAQSENSPQTLEDLQHMFIKQNLAEVEKKERVREATVKQLQEIINDPELSPSEKQEERSRSYSTSVIPSYPQINYVSMSADETLFDNSLININDIAAKYLPKEYHIEERTTNKTVTFEGVYEWQTPTKHNMRNINFSCNMSIASKKYLQKYDLAETDVSMAQPLSHTNGRSEHQRNVTPKKNDFEKDKENILDFAKLRNLPKLL